MKPYFKWTSRLLSVDSIFFDFKSDVFVNSQTSIEDKNDGQSGVLFLLKKILSVSRKMT